MSEQTPQEKDKSVLPLAIIIITTAILLFLALGGVPGA